MAIKVVIIGFEPEEIEKVDRNVYEIESSLNTYYEIIGCDYIDIVQCEIGNRMYDLIIDDEGMMKEFPIPTVYKITRNGLEPAIVGNCIICKHDAEGNTIGLTDEDIEIIKKQIRNINGDFYSVLLINE